MDDKQHRAIQEALMSKEVQKPSFYFSTGSTIFDLVVGGGETDGYGLGYEAGTIVRDWGNTSSSKTFKLSECIAANHYKYKDNFKWIYDDTEFGNKFNSQALYGFDIIPPDPAKQTHSRTVEDMFNNVYSFLDSLKGDDIGIYGVDSLDGLSSAEMEERKDERRKAFAKGKEFNDGTYGGGAPKFLSQEFFRGLASDLTKKNALLYIISQERDNLNAGMYGKKIRLAGGKAITFHETVRIYSKAKQIMEDKNIPIGVVVEILAEKVRHPHPLRSCILPIYFEYGIDGIAANIDFLYSLRTPTTGELKAKAADNLTWDDEEFTRDDLVKHIEKNKLQNELAKRTIAKWDADYDAVKLNRATKYGM